jgi:hypothetical protein
MTELEASTVAQQRLLAGYCRNGNLVPIDGAKPSRLETYRRLVFSGIRDALVQSYPLTQALLTEHEWANLVHDFFEQHKCVEPQIWKMPFELIAFVKEKQGDLQTKYPQLIDLLEFEWLEIALYMMPDIPYPMQRSGNPNLSQWIFNPEHRFMRLDFPVHLLNASRITAKDKGVYNVLAYRHQQTGAVHFINLNLELAEALLYLSSGKGSIAEYTAHQTIKDRGLLNAQLLRFFELYKQKGLII